MVPHDSLVGTVVDAALFVPAVGVKTVLAELGVVRVDVFAFVLDVVVAGEFIVVVEEAEEPLVVALGVTLFLIDVVVAPLEQPTVVLLLGQLAVAILVVILVAIEALLL